MKENSHNSRTSDDIYMKLGPVTKLDKKNKITSNKITMMQCRKIMTYFLFFKFMANLEQFGSWIQDAESAKLMFSLIKTFCITETENKANCTPPPSHSLSQPLKGPPRLGLSHLF